MKARAVGSAIVVALGLVPTLLGGPVFALLLVVLGLCGYREFLALTAQFGASIVHRANVAGYMAIMGFALLGLAGLESPGLFVMTALAVIVPLAILVPSVDVPHALTNWSLSVAGSLYLGLPVFAAVALRSLPGRTSSASVLDPQLVIHLPWDAATRGLGWALTAILATWIGDTVAYVVGRSFGRRKLAPHVSPGKTVEGACAGLIGSSLTGGASFVAFGIGPWWIGLFVGVMIGLTGQLGDLSESFLKRQAGVKDSGTIIPGHGGILDRIDALLFAFPVSLALAIGFERFLAP